MGIIPAINASDFKTIEEQIFAARNFLPPEGWLHIDVVDGRFAMNVTWNDPKGFTDFLSTHITLRRINFEMHLMVLEPEKFMEDWLKAGARRVIIHEEAMVDPVFVAAKCGEWGADAMLAIKPETPVEELFPHTENFRFFQILAVPPGFAGQSFKPEVINKISALRERAPNATIEVDGGMTPERVRSCRHAGADLFVSASYIYGSLTPVKSYNDLLAASES